jgi:siroheme synthase (precorrin-2 oxidase/ferrochelatase)
MPNNFELSPALRGKSPQEQARLAQAIMAAAREGRFPLNTADLRNLSAFVVQIHQGHLVDDTLMLAVSTLCRHYEQYLIAKARGGR